jgi:ketosteroid isomerase-like protein
MANENEELIRGAYDAYARGDLNVMLEVLDRDLEWTYLDPAFPNAEPQTCHGRDRLADGLRAQARRGLKSQVEEVIGNEDRLLVTVRTPGADQFRARTTGDLSYDVLTIRHGRIVALRACRDRNQALAVSACPAPGRLDVSRPDRRLAIVSTRRPAGRRLMPLRRNPVRAPRH